MSLDYFTEAQKKELAEAFTEALKKALPKHEDGSYDLSGVCWACIDSFECANKNDGPVCPRITNALKG